MWCVYVLKSGRNGRLYVGSTDNLERRLAEHDRGKSAYTRHLRPLALVYAESLADSLQARRRERFLKSGQGREFLRQQLRPARFGESAARTRRRPAPAVSSAAPLRSALPPFEPHGSTRWKPCATSSCRSGAMPCR